MSENKKFAVYDVLRTKKARSIIAACCFGSMLSIPAYAEIVLIGDQALPPGQTMVAVDPNAPTFTGMDLAPYNPNVTNMLSVFGRVYNAFDVIKGTHGTNIGYHDYSSSIGVRGARAINPDFTIVYQLDNQVSNYDGTGTFASRESFFGIASPKYGALRAGRFQNSYDRHSVFGDSATDEQGMGITQVLWANCGSAPNISGYTASNACFDNKQADSIRYDTPAMGPFFGSIQISSSSQGTSSTNSMIGPRSLSTSLTFKQWPFIAAVGWEHHSGMTTINKITQSASGSLSATSLGTNNGGDNALEFVAGYQITPQIYVGGIVERLSYAVNSNGDKISRNMAGLAARYYPGKWRFEINAQRAFSSSTSGNVADGTCAGNVCAGANTGAKEFTETVRYDYTPNFGVYLQLVQLRNDSKGLYSIKNYAVSSYGESANGYSLGFQYTF
jgi:predicted porin